MCAIRTHLMAHYLRVGLSVLLLGLEKVVLPVDDVARGDVADALGSEVRDDLVVDHVLLGGPCALAQIGAHVIGVDSDEVREPHVEGALRTAEKLRFEALGVLARGERDCGGDLGPNPSYAASRPKSLRYCMGLL